MRFHSRQRGFTGPLLTMGVPLAMVLAFVAVRQSSNTIVLGSSWEGQALIPIESFDHDAWSGLLRKYVDDEGRVDYDRWHQNENDLQKLVDYLESLSRVQWNSDRTPYSRSDDSRPFELAFWINAYNALTIHAVLDIYPTPSVRRHTNPVGFNLWHHYKLMIGSRAWSLADMENGRLHQLNEPRIHFALVKASNSCPSLRREAYVAGSMERQLADNTTRFFEDSNNLHVEGAHRLHLSSVIRLALADSGQQEEIQRQAIASWVPDQKIAKMVTSDTVRLLWLRHDWSLNKKR